MQTVLTHPDSRQPGIPERYAAPTGYPGSGRWRCVRVYFPPSLKPGVVGEALRIQMLGCPATGLLTVWRHSIHLYDPYGKDVLAVTAGGRLRAERAVGWDAHIRVRMS